jgi:hypothetical protein
LLARCFDLPLVAEEKVRDASRRLPRGALFAVLLTFAVSLATFLYLSPTPITFGTEFMTSGPTAHIAIVARLNDYGVVGSGWRRDADGSLYLSDPFFYKRRGTVLGLRWFEGAKERPNSYSFAYKK